MQASGEEGQKIWESIKNLKKTEDNFNRTQSMANTGKPNTASANKRPLTAYYNSIEGVENTFSQTQTVRRGAGTGSTLKSGEAVLSQAMSYVTSQRSRDPRRFKAMREATQAMDEIKCFERKHKLTKLGRPENKYPHVQLEAHYAMEKKFFQG